MNFFFLEDTREGFASHADVLALERLRGRLAKVWSWSSHREPTQAVCLFMFEM